MIAGAGIGGLTAAIALSQAGIHCLVLERVGELREIGAGLTLWPNATRILDTLGIGKAIQAAGATIAMGQLRDQRGVVLSQMPFGEIARAAGAPFVALHRAALQSILLEACPAPIRLGTAVTSFEQDPTGVTVRLANGDTERGDLLIGADGLHSAVRAQLLGKQPPRYAGYTAWRGIATVTHPDIPRDVTTESTGAGQRFGIVPIGPDRVYWFATANVPEGGIDPPDSKDALARRFAGWHSPIPAVIAATEPSAILRNDIYDRVPVRAWGTGRVTLLGDAAHPTTPNIGQGACLAIEDAAVLVASLQRARSIPAALARYQALRVPRTAAIVERSWQFGRVAQWEHPLATWLRSRLYQLIPERVMRRQLAAFIQFDT